MSASTIPLWEVLDSARSGEELPGESASVFVDASGSSLNELCHAAAHIRDMGKGKTVTFSPKVFIPLTRLCRDFCSYCTFRQDPGEAGEHLYMTPEEVLEVAQAGQRLGRPGETEAP